MHETTDTALFREAEPRTEEITIRLTHRQKQRILEMAKTAGKPASRWIISIISAEHERQLHESITYRVYNSDDAQDAGKDDNDPPF